MNASIKRYAFVDILKGIAILLIVYGHVIPGSIPFLTDWISTFHIPLFFFVSGLLFNDSKYKDNFKEYVAGRVRGLVLPFLIFSAIVAVGYLFVVENYLSFLKGLFVVGWGGYALWFVPVLLMVEFIYYPLSKFGYKWRILVLIISFILSYISSIKIGFISNNVLLTLCGLYFYGIGNLCRPILKYSENQKTYQICVVSLLGLVLSLIYLPVCAVLPEWFINKIPSPIFYITPLFAIAGMIGISILVNQYLGKIIGGILSSCGKQSFIILAFHQIICMIAGQYVPSKIVILIMIVSLVFLVLFIPKYLPWILGKQKT